MEPYYQTRIQTVRKKKKKYRASPEACVHPRKKGTHKLARATAHTLFPLSNRLVGR